ncbi:MAG: YidC/Oxa1 family membrane protein insertase, partial [Actinomycetota bacterium]
MLDGLYSALGAVLSFFYDLIPNYGIAIILLTIFVRVILLPLTIKQTKSMQKMQKIGPEMKALQAKHKGDKAKLNEEMMKLYKEHQVNPLGGCLPLLMQFPVFIALFRVLNTCGVAVAKGKACAANQIGTRYLPANSALLAAIHAQNAATTFLGLSMAATPRDVLKTGIVPSIPYFGLLAAMGLTTWYQTRQAAAAQPPGAGANQMAIMGKIMPVMLMFFSFGFPAGVSLY